jgi:hypothetical protein
METGLFDIAAPLFELIDEAFAGILGDTARIILWGIAAGAASMGIYRLTSPQKKIEQAKSDSVAARKALSSYDGDFDGILPLAGRSLATSLRHFGLALGPALLGSLPVIFVMAWMSGSFGYHVPDPGEDVEIKTIGQTEPLSWSSGIQVSGADQWTVRWPNPDSPISLRDPSGASLVSLPLSHPVPIKHKRMWWNALFANPLGSLPDDAPIDVIELDLKPKVFLPLGPAWMQGWEALFIVFVLVSSVAIKVIFRIR